MKLLLLSLLFIHTASAGQDKIEHALNCLTNANCLTSSRDYETVFSPKSDIKNFKSSTGQTALHYLLAGIDVKTSTEQRQRIYEYCDKILKLGVDINGTTHQGLTALHETVLFDDILTLQFLLTKGADKNFKAPKGKFKGMTSLEFAQFLQKKNVFPNRSKIINLLQR